MRAPGRSQIGKQSIRRPLAFMLPLVALVAAFPRKPPDFNILSRRIDAQKSEEGTCRCLMLDTMVPRQRLNLQFGPPVTGYLREARDEGISVAVLGMDTRDGHFLRRGVEARIESMSPYRASDGFFSSHSTSPMRGYTALDTVLVGGRRFEILELIADKPGSKYHKAPPAPTWPPVDPTFLARVRWLPEEEGTAGARLRAEDLPPLVEEWIELVRKGKRERSPGQIDAILRDLGPMCEAETPDEIAFWCAGLINPIPALGVCKEIRPQVLESDDSLQRIEIVREALLDSLDRLEKMPPGPFEVEPPPRRNKGEQ